MVILEKKYCIRNIKKTDDYIINPFLNIIYKRKSLDDSCIILPQRINNVLQDININDDLIDVSNNKIYNFMTPINSNNFLEIIFNIISINSLYEWFINYDKTDISTINLVFSIYWIKNINIILDNIEDFIKLNQILIQYIYNKNINIKDISKIIMKIIKKYNNKKIKYLNIIKKYILKYI